MKLHIPVAVSITLAAGLLLAGCASPVPTAAASGSPAPAASAATSAPPAPASGKHVDLCKAVPLATLEKVTGKSYATTQDVADQKAQGLEASSCGYNGTQDSQQNFAIKVFYGTPSATLTYLAGVDSSQFGEDLTTNVSGIGDKALTDGSDDLAVQYGNDVVYVEDVSEPPGADLVPLSQMEQLAAMVHSAMK
jgi:outer membrane protein TolC